MAQLIVQECTATANSHFKCYDSDHMKQTPLSEEKKPLKIFDNFDLNSGNTWEDFEKHFYNNNKSDIITSSFCPCHTMQKFILYTKTVEIVLLIKPRRHREGQKKKCTNSAKNYTIDNYKLLQFMIFIGKTFRHLVNLKINFLFGMQDYHVAEIMNGLMQKNIWKYSHHIRFTKAHFAHITMHLKRLQIDAEIVSADARQAFVKMIDKQSDDSSSSFAPRPVRISFSRNTFVNHYFLSALSIRGNIGVAIFAQPFKWSDLCRPPSAIIPKNLLLNRAYNLRTLCLKQWYSDSETNYYDEDCLSSALSKITCKDKEENAKCHDRPQQQTTTSNHKFYLRLAKESSEMETLSCNLIYGCSGALFRSSYLRETFPYAIFLHANNKSIRKISIKNIELSFDDEKNFLAACKKYHRSTLKRLTLVHNNLGSENFQKMIEAAGPTVFANLEKLKVTNNKLTDEIFCNNGAFRDAEKYRKMSLLSLDLSHNQFTLRLPPQIYAGLQFEFPCIYLPYCKHNAVNLFSSAWLKRINLSHNCIQSLCSNNSAFRVILNAKNKLELLDLSHNDIQEIDSNAFKHLFLEDHYRDDDLMHEVAALVLGKKSLLTIDLSHNSKVQCLPHGLLAPIGARLKNVYY